MDNIDYQKKYRLYWPFSSIDDRLFLRMITNFGHDRYRFLGEHGEELIYDVIENVSFGRHYIRHSIGFVKPSNHDKCRDGNPIFNFGEEYYLQIRNYMRESDSANLSYSKKLNYFFDCFYPAILYMQLWGNNKKIDELIQKYHNNLFIEGLKSESIASELKARYLETKLYNPQKMASKASKTKKYTSYLMVDTATGYTKIGRSTNPESRERTLQSEKPTIELLHIFKNDIEGELHLKYKEKRIRGEWFDLNGEEINQLIQL